MIASRRDAGRRVGPEPGPGRSPSRAADRCRHQGESWRVAPAAVGRRPPVAGAGLAPAGLPPVVWGQRERAPAPGRLVRLGVLVVGLFAWGTAAGPVLLAFAFAAHVASAADAIRQWAFPGFGRWVPDGLGLGRPGPAGYAPALLGGLGRLAGMEAGAGPREGYLVNRWAYRERAARRRRPRLARPAPGGPRRRGSPGSSAGPARGRVGRRPAPGRRAVASDWSRSARARPRGRWPSGPRGPAPGRLPDRRLAAPRRRPGSWSPASRVEGRAWAQALPGLGRAGSLI